jgi:hypothetical protein
MIAAPISLASRTSQSVRAAEAASSGDTASMMSATASGSSDTTEKNIHSRMYPVVLGLVSEMSFARHYARNATRPRATSDSSRHDQNGHYATMPGPWWRPLAIIFPAEMQTAQFRVFDPDRPRLGYAAGSSSPRSPPWVRHRMTPAACQAAESGSAGQWRRVGAGILPTGPGERPSAHPASAARQGVQAAHPRNLMPQPLLGRDLGNAILSHPCLVTVPRAVRRQPVLDRQPACQRHVVGGRLPAAGARLGRGLVGDGPSVEAQPDRVSARWTAPYEHRCQGRVVGHIRQQVEDLGMRYGFTVPWGPAMTARSALDAVAQCLQVLRGQPGRMRRGWPSPAPVSVPHSSALPAR